jgi:hypothetical protein
MEAASVRFPQLVANGANEKGILSDNSRRKLIVDQVRQHSRRPLAASNRDSAPANHSFTRFDDNAARTLGIK